MYFSRILSQKSEMYSPYLNESIVNLLDKTFSIPANFSTHLYRVEEEYVARPDLLSLDIFGDERYAELICKINGISNPYELAEGMYLIIPGFDSIENFYLLPADEWKESEVKMTEEAKQILIPALKKRTDKRKPNEAITGDKRFNIDPISKIVIY